MGRQPELEIGLNLCEGAVSKKTLKRLKKNPLRFQAKTMVCVEQCLKKKPLKSKQKPFACLDHCYLQHFCSFEKRLKKKPLFNHLPGGIVLPLVSGIASLASVRLEHASQLSRD